MIKNKFNILPIILLVLTLSIVAFAGSPLPDYKPQFFDANGNPLTSGSLKLCNPGTTNVKTIYTNSGLTVPKANPVNLDSSGRAEVWLNGTYDVYLYDGQNATGNLIYTLYNISSISAAATPFTPNYIDASEYGDLAATVTTLGTVTNYEVWVTDQQTLTGNVEVPENIVIRVIMGGIIVADGYSLNFDSNNLVAEPNQCIFTGFTADTTGVTFDEAMTVYPEWWGAVGDVDLTTRTGTDDTSCLQSSIASLTPSGGIIKLSKWYGVLGSISGTSPNQWTSGLTTVANNVTMEGLGAKNSGLCLVGSTYPGYIIRDNNEEEVIGWTFRNMGFYSMLPDATPDNTPHVPSAAASAAIRFYLFTKTTITNCEFNDFNIIGSFYGGLGTTTSIGLWFQNNRINCTGIVPYMGVGVTNGKDIWIEHNEFVNVAYAVSLETYGYDIYNFHVNHNTFRGLTGSSHSTSNTAVGVQLNPYTGSKIYDGEISGNVCSTIVEDVAQVSGGLALVSCYGVDEDSIYNVSITGNTLTSITADASTPSCYGMFFYRCKALSVIGNVFPDIAPSGTSSYGMYISDVRFSSFIGNIIMGTGWTSPFYEAATLECNNTFIGNITENGCSFPNITTSKSLVFQDNVVGARLDWLLGQWSARIAEDGYLYLGKNNAAYDLTLIKNTAGILSVGGTLNINGIPEYTDNAAAAAAGMPAGGLYRTGDTLKVVH